MEPRYDEVYFEGVDRLDHMDAAVLFVAGDLFKLDVKAIGHGCNCAGAMGKGIAKQFRALYPDMYRRYKELCDKRQFTLGSVYPWEAEDGKKTIYNLGTQVHWGSKASLDAIGTSVKKMLNHAQANGRSPVAIPRIGAGLGGCSWDEVSEVLTRAAVESKGQLIVVERQALKYEGFTRDPVYP